MNFDIKQCMEQDGGKCICVSNDRRLNARILCHNLCGAYRLVVAAMEADGIEHVHCCVEDGSRYINVFLENLPKTREMYVFILADIDTGIIAHLCSSSSEYDGLDHIVLASKKVTLTEGEYITKAERGEKV